jgi:hypothetical protein
VKILPAVAELIHADGKTDRHKEANSRFSQFCEGSYKQQFILHCPSQIWLRLFAPIELSLSLLTLLFYVTTTNKPPIIKQLRILTKQQFAFNNYPGYYVC